MNHSPLIRQWCSLKKSNRKRWPKKGADTLCAICLRDSSPSESYQGLGIRFGRLLRSGRRGSLLTLLTAVVVAWWADVTFLGGGNSPLENKPGVEGKKYDGSDINPEDRSKEIQFYKLIRRILLAFNAGSLFQIFSGGFWGKRWCLRVHHPFQELGKTEWEVQWWRDMKSQQEALSKKAAIEKERAGHWAYHCNVFFSFCWNSAFDFVSFFLDVPTQERGWFWKCPRNIVATLQRSVSFVLYSLDPCFISQNPAQNTTPPNLVPIFRIMWGDSDGEQLKILLYLFGFLIFGTLLVLLPGFLGLRWAWPHLQHLKVLPLWDRNSWKTISFLVPRDAPQALCKKVLLETSRFLSLFTSKHFRFATFTFRETAWPEVELGEAALLDEGPELERNWVQDVS